MTNVGAEMASLEIANRVEDLLAALPVGTSSDTRQAITETLDAMMRAADLFADAAEAKSS